MALVTDRQNRRPGNRVENRGRADEIDLVGRRRPGEKEGVPPPHRRTPRRSGPDVGSPDPGRVLGRLLIWLGALVLLFAAFQLWGTGLLAWHAQRALDAEFDRRRAVVVAADDPTADRGGDAATERRGDAATDRGVVAAGRAGAVAMGLRLGLPTTRPNRGEPAFGVRPAAVDGPVAEGTPVARIEIPAIGLRQTILQGVQRQTLRSGPGHYPSTPMPGQGGNVAIAGHRTTYGAPFLELDELEPGDRIDVETVDGVFRYEVQGHDDADGTSRGHHIVDPADVDVIGDHGDDRLTLTACHPRFSARQRIIVTATLVEQPPQGAPAAPLGPPAVRPAAATTAIGAATQPGDETASIDGTAPIDDTAPRAGPDAERLTADPSATVSGSPDSFEASLGWRAEELDPTTMWATVTALVLHVGWVLGRLWRRRWAYAITAPVAAVPLIVCFVHLDRLLPAF